MRTISVDYSNVSRGCGLARSGSPPEAPQNKRARADWLDGGSTSPNGRACRPRLLPGKKIPAKRTASPGRPILVTYLILPSLLASPIVYHLIDALLSHPLSSFTTQSPTLRPSCSQRIRPSGNNQHISSPHNNRRSSRSAAHPLTPSYSQPPT